MNNKFFLIYNRHKTIISNFGYLSILQGLNLFIPLITYPYLIRVLGSSVYGNVIFAQSVISFFLIVVSFGFEISGVKNVAENQENKNKLGEIVSSVFFIKFTLFVISLFALIFFLFFYKIESYSLYLLTFGICIGDVFFPVWFFQGIEKMKYTTIINVGIRLFFTVCIFIFIHNPEDYLCVPLLNSLGAVFGGVSSLLILIRIEKIKILIPNFKTIKKYFCESLPFFTSRVSAVILSEANTLIIGSFISMSGVAYYDLAKKIVNVFLIPNSIFNSVAYPHIAKTKNKKIVRKILNIRILIAFFMYVLLFVSSNLIVLFLGGENMLHSIPLVNLLGINIIITSVSYYLGGTVLVSFNKSKYFNLSVIYSLLIYLFTFICIYFFTDINVYSLIVLTLCTEFLIAMYRYYYCRKFSLL